MYSKNDIIPSITGLVIAGAGCGHGAMSGDEIGRLAAELALTGQWDSDVNRDMFRIQFKCVKNKL